MKKTISLYLLLLFPMISFTQNVRFGFTASPTMGFNSIDPSNNIIADGFQFEEESDSKFGLQYGIMADFDINSEERYFFNTGLVMHHTGFKFSSIGGITAMTNEYDVSAQYIEIPTTLKLKTNEIGFLRYYGQFGLNHGINVGTKIKSPEDANEAEVDLTGYNAALNVGGGIEHNLSGDTSLAAGIFYNNGFSKVLDDSRGILKQNQIGLRIGVFF